MQVVERIADLRALLQRARYERAGIGLVPTMGALHAAHLKLAEEARRENDLVVMSIFVNPTQFGPNEDFERYPRSLERDRQLIEASGFVDLLFTPSIEDMYPDGPDRQAVWVDVLSLSRRLEGAARPGHFRGVATVVTKLFNVVEPDRAYFGEKDIQQVAVLKRLVKDLLFPVEIRAIATVREADGLAASSRNAFLSSAERAEAPALYEALRWAREAFERGLNDPRLLEAGVRSEIERRAPLAQIDYVSVVDPETFEEVHGKIEGRAVLALAVNFSGTRLIDNETLDGGH